VRDTIIANPMVYPDIDFCQMFRLSMSVNWPLSDSDSIYSDSETGQITLSSAFQDHICDLRHWTVSELFRARWPELYVAINSR
jgi:hypothetical protein